ncbi:MAG: glycosyltransferase, partial [Gemmatimonadota bacterium]
MLHITSSYPSSDADPRGIFVKRIVQGQRDQGAQVRVLAPGAPGLPDTEVQEGVLVHRAAYWVGSGQHLTRGLSGIAPNLRERPWLFPQLVSLVAALARVGSRLGEDHDVIHAHWLYPAGLAGVWAARRTGRPLVVTSHGGDLNLAMSSRMLRKIAGAVARSADACVAVSETLVGSFQRLGVSDSAIVMIPYGIDPGMKADPEPKDPVFVRYRSAEGVRLVYIGSLIPRKSVRTLLEAHTALERRGMPVTTLIVGAGPLAEDLKRYAVEQSLTRVLFAGEQPPSAIPHYLRASHALVLPSLSEGRPNVVLEAMAQGRLVLASDIPGSREMIEEGRTGMLFPARDAVALARCIERLLDEDARIGTMGRQAEQMVRRGGMLTEDNARKHLA